MKPRLKSLMVHFGDEWVALPVDEYGTVGRP
jgi:hypothetical protein